VDDDTCSYPCKRALMILRILDLLAQPFQRLKATFDESDGVF
jgi:hypothetical protein